MGFEKWESIKSELMVLFETLETCIFIVQKVVV